MNGLKKIIEKNEYVLSQIDLKERPDLWIFHRLFKDIIEKSKSILILKEADLHIGISSIARSIIESYVYMKYIFEDKYTYFARSEAYYLKGCLDEMYFFDKINTDKELQQFFKISKIEPLLNDGRKYTDILSEILQRYGELTVNENLKDMNNLPKFYATGKFRKKIKAKNSKKEYVDIYINNSFSKLCKYVGESTLYKVFYNILSSEVHSTTNNMTQNITEDIIRLCIKINQYILESFFIPSQNVYKFKYMKKWVIR